MFQMMKNKNKTKEENATEMNGKELKEEKTCRKRVKEMKKNNMKVRMRTGRWMRERSKRY